MHLHERLHSPFLALSFPCSPFPPMYHHKKKIKERTEHDMCTICNPSYTNHTRQNLIQRWKEGKSSTQKTEKLGGTGQAF
jgi:hypothetical protein